MRKGITPTLEAYNRFKRKYKEIRRPLTIEDVIEVLVDPPPFECDKCAVGLLKSLKEMGLVEYDKDKYKVYVK